MTHRSDIGKTLKKKICIIYNFQPSNFAREFFDISVTFIIRQMKIKNENKKKKQFFFLSLANAQTHIRKNPSYPRRNFRSLNDLSCYARLGDTLFTFFFFSFLFPLDFPVVRAPELLLFLFFFLGGRERERKRKKNLITVLLN